MRMPLSFIRTDGGTDTKHQIGAVVWRKGVGFSAGRIIDKWTPHRVLRITKSRVFIERGDHDGLRDAIKAMMIKMGRRVTRIPKTLSLSRTDLESYGKTHYGRDWQEFHVSRPIDGFINHELEILGLASQWPARVEEIKRAYHEKARETHPDLGGSAEKFQAVQRAYEAAMQMAGAA